MVLLKYYLIRIDGVDALGEKGEGVGDLLYYYRSIKYRLEDGDVVEG